MKCSSIFTLVVVVILMLSACAEPASKAPELEPTETAGPTATVVPTATPVAIQTEVPAGEFWLTPDKPYPLALRDLSGTAFLVNKTGQTVYVMCNGFLTEMPSESRFHQPGCELYKANYHLPEYVELTLPQSAQLPKWLPAHPLGIDLKVINETGKPIAVYCDALTKPVSIVQDGTTEVFDECRDRIYRIEWYDDSISDT